MIGEDNLRDQALVLRIEGEKPQLQASIDQLDRNAARKTAADLHLDLWKFVAVALDVIEQVKCGRFVGADDQSPGRHVAQLGQRVFHLAFQVFKAARVIEYDLAGIGQRSEER